MLTDIREELANVYKARKSAEDERLRQVYDQIAKNEKLSGLIKQKADFEILLIKNEIEKKSSVEELKYKIETLDSMIKKALKEEGLNLNKLYVCSKCNDTGFVKGKLCTCAVQSYLTILKRRSGIKSIPSFSFEENRISQINCKQQAYVDKFYTEMEKLCDRFPESKIKSIIFSGTVGCGKTCLISAIANRLLSLGHFVLYLSAFEMNDIFLEYHLAKMEDKYAILSPLIEADLLIVDDLGVEPMRRDVTINYLYKIVSDRLADNKSIMITTNLDENTLIARYTERTISRLTEKGKSFFGRMGGDDLRKVLSK